MGHPVADGNFRYSALLGHPFVIEVMAFEPLLDFVLEYGLIPHMLHVREFIRIFMEDKTALSPFDTYYEGLPSESISWAISSLTEHPDSMAFLHNVE